MNTFMTFSLLNYNFFNVLAFSFCLNIEAEKTAAISQTPFLERKRSNCDWYFAEFCSLWLNWLESTFVQRMAWRRPATSHSLNQWWLDYRRIYESLCLNDLTIFYLVSWTLPIWNLPTAQLTHCGIVTPYAVRHLGKRWLRLSFGLKL